MNKDEIICLCGIVFSVILMFFFPVFSQIKSEVNNGAFNKLIKIKKMAFMFRAPSGISVSKEGVALPLFIMQLMGYIISAISIILNAVMLIWIKVPIRTMAIVTFSIMGAEILVMTIVTIILETISHPKKRSKR